MRTIRIDRLEDPRLDDYRNVRDPDLAARGGLFIAEGRLVVARLLGSRRFRTRSLMLTEAARTSLGELIDRADDVPVFVVSQAVMNGVTGLNIHRGCLAIGERTPPPGLRDLVAGARRLVVLERVANADNVGAIFRNAAAFGVDALLMDEATTDPLYRKSIRTSMGAALRVPFARAEPLANALDTVVDCGLTLVALTPRPAAPALATLAHSLRSQRLAIVVGHEGEGLTSGTLARCNLQVRLPMSDAVDSINVATAAAIALYALA